jgi:RNA polymerase sigma-70 factor (ECF subfamily)
MDIYRRYGPAIMRKCQRMLGNVQDAEDIVQGLFVDLLKKKKTDVDLPYLYRAATNRCLNYIRDKKKRAALLAKQADSFKNVENTRLDERAISRQMLVKLADLLDKKSREILVYRFFDDMGQEEIASLTGYSRKTVGKRLKVIRDTIEVLYAKEEGEVK